jgi:hypothetical protein
MTEFYMRPEGGQKADVTLVGFTSIDALIAYVREVGEVTLIAEDRRPNELLTMVVPNG